VSETDEDIQVVDEAPMSLWSAESKNIIVQSTGGTRIIVPREVKDHVKRELYEYPYIKNANRLALSKPMDIVFLSNGETGAEENWEHLQRITKNIPKNTFFNSFIYFLLIYKIVIKPSVIITVYIYLKFRCRDC